MYLKNSLIILTFLFQFYFSFAQKSKKYSFFELKGVFSEKTSLKKIYFSYVNNKDLTVNDSVGVINNTFILKGAIDLPTEVNIFNNNKYEFMEDSYTIFYAAPKRMQMKLNPSSFNIIEFNGSQSQIEYAKLNALKQDFFEIQKSTVKLMREYYKEIKNIKDSLTIKHTERKIDSLQNIYNQNELNEVNINVQFASENLNSFVVPKTLLYSLDRNISKYKEIDSVFTKVDNSIKASFYGKKLKETLFNLKNSSVGSKAPSFLLKDINGILISLENIKGKYVLIDFWASWCAPCRSDFPFVKELYKNYKDKGFEIVSISYHDEANAWKKAITKESTELWTNISIEENKSNTAEDYYVTSIPLKILIDKNGIIIGRWNGKNEQHNNEIQKILEKSF